MLYILVKQLIEMTYILVNGLIKMTSVSTDTT